MASKGSKTRRHHYISANYLKNFATPRDREKGRLYALDKVRIPVKATGESGRRRPPNPVEGDQFGAEPSDARLMFIGKVAYRDSGIKSAA